VLGNFKGVYGEARTAALKSDFSDLMARTGHLRDLDVYLMGRDAYFALLPDTLHAGLTRLFDIYASERAAAHKRLAAWLQSPEYAREITRLDVLFAGRKRLEPGPMAQRTAYDYACELIWKRYRNVCKIALSITPDTPDEEVHRLRIACKKLRYLMEFFAPLFPKKKLKTLVGQLKVLQDNLGHFNDYSVQQEALLDFLGSQSKAARDLEIAKSVGALVAIMHRRQREERARVEESFATFNADATQGSFRALFHGKDAA